MIHIWKSHADDSTHVCVIFIHTYLCIKSSHIAALFLLFLVDNYQFGMPFVADDNAIDFIGRQLRYISLYLVIKPLPTCGCTGMLGQPWHWVCVVWTFSPSLRIDCNSLRRFSIAELYEIYMHVLPQINPSVGKLCYSSAINQHLSLRQNFCQSADDIFKWIFEYRNCRKLIPVVLKYVPKYPVNDKPAFVQIMALHRGGGVKLLFASILP